MFDWLRENTNTRRYAGIDLYDDGIAIAIVDVDKHGAPAISAARWYAKTENTSTQGILEQAVKDLDMRGLVAFATLPHTAYYLVQLEAPELPEDELRDAMRWRIKDLIDFPVEQAVVDIFHLPPSQRPGAPPLLYVVAAENPVVESLASAMTAAGLKVGAVDIVEMAIRNLAIYLDKPGRPRAYLDLQPGETVIEIADNEHVYLSRRVMHQFDSDADEELLGAQMESLALEVQRSIDYFESQYAMGPADRLSVIVCDESLFDVFQQVAASFLTIKVERFSFTKIEFADDVSLTSLERGVTAIGSAMRGLSWAA